MATDYEQMNIFSEMEEKKIDSEFQEIAMELFQDTTPISRIEKQGFINKSNLDNVKKGRTRLVDNVILVEPSRENQVELETEELSELTHNMVTSRITLSFDHGTEGAVTCSRALTNFDREVIDAVSSLATTTQIMTAAMIFRVITGKNKSTTVNKEQKLRVEESMNRCARCQVTIDISKEVTEHPSFQGSQEDQTWFLENAISFRAIKHQSHKGTTIYYKITSMPPFYRFAAKLGKVSVIPFSLLASPVSKTDATIAIQSYLLREIAHMKLDAEVLPEICWQTIYKIAEQEGKTPSATEKHRIRDNVHRILEFWIEEGFIYEFESDTKQDRILFSF